jgi:central kinetochore subunit Mis15/CHL4
MTKKRKPSTTVGALSNKIVIPYSPLLRRLLTRLSKGSLLELVFRWLDTTTVDLSQGEDGEDDEDLEMYTVRGVYQEYEKSKRVRAKEVVERIVEHEWRGGLTLLQIAEVDYRCLFPCVFSLSIFIIHPDGSCFVAEIDLVDHPSTHKWTAAILSPVGSGSASSPPHFYPATFTHTLQSLLRPMVVPHYFTARHPTLPLTLLRLQLHDPASASALTFPPAKRIFWLAFPEGAGRYVYYNIGTGADSLRDVVRQSIADAVSRAHARFELRPANLSARTLEAVAFYKGCGGGEGGMVGAWSIYLEGGADGGVLDSQRMVQEKVEEDVVDQVAAKRRKIAEGRFGNGATEGDGTALEKVEFRLDERFPGGDEDNDDEEEFRPKVTVRFEGSHVFAGIRSMVEQGVGFDGLKMPGWITGEEGVTVGTIKDGRLLKRKGTINN